jgi:RNA polymerase sigma-70 factor (ECF subfamily)
MHGEKAECGSLVEKISEGDRGALGELYERMKSPVFGLALAILKNRSDAEDVAQSAFLRVWESAGSYRAGTDAGAWIMTITRNLALDRFRRRKNMTDIMDMADTLPGGDDLTPKLDRMLLEHLLSELDCSERQIVMLRAVGGYSHGEIARILGRPCATVRWKYGRAVKKLQALFAKEEAHDENRKQVRFAAGNCK